MIVTDDEEQCFSGFDGIPQSVTIRGHEAGQ